MRRCLAGICSPIPKGGKAASQHTEVIRPAGLKEEARETAPRVRMWAHEQTFAKGALLFGAYPALAFRLARCDAGALKSALSAALAAHPMAAGRWLEKDVLLTNEGVPFTVCDSSEKSAPEPLEDEMLLRLSDLRRGGRVLKGREPLMTVKLTRYGDGSAILVMARSHGLFDGTSAWVFVADWAAAARGEPVEGRMAEDRKALLGLLPSDEEHSRLALDLWGKEHAATRVGKVSERIFFGACPLFDSIFLSGLSFPNRPQVFFSDDEVARIKAAATPAPGGAGDGWVSTQEALAAYILSTGCRILLPASSKGRAFVTMLVDIRSAAGLPQRTCGGTCFVFHHLRVDGVLQKTLAEVAGALHESAKEQAAEEIALKRFRDQIGAAERGVIMDHAFKTMAMRNEVDITFQLNNQSKRVLPDFGTEASGGAVRAVLATAGPTLMLPARGGIKVLLCSSFIDTGKQAAAIVSALRSQIPAR